MGSIDKNKKIVQLPSVDFPGIPLTALAEKNLQLIRCETQSQFVSLAPPSAPLKLSLLHSIVFHMLLTTPFHNKLFISTIKYAIFTSH